MQMCHPVYRIKIMSVRCDTNLILPAASLHGDARGARGPDRGRGRAVDAAVVALGVDLLLPGRALRHARRPRIRTLRRDGAPHRLPHAGAYKIVVDIP